MNSTNHLFLEACQINLELLLLLDIEIVRMMTQWSLTKTVESTVLVLGSNLKFVSCPLDSQTEL